MHSITESLDAYGLKHKPIFNGLWLEDIGVAISDTEIDGARDLIRIVGDRAEIDTEFLLYLFSILKSMQGGQ